MFFEMRVKLILLLLQVRRYRLVDILEHAIHSWLGLALGRFERLWEDRWVRTGTSTSPQKLSLWLVLAKGCGSMDI